MFLEVYIVIICWELFFGLEYFYVEGKIYCDIKVVNVLLLEIGKVKFVDFGVVV